MHEPTPPTLNKRGQEVHPAFGSISAHRVTGGAGALFDSDVQHNQFVRVTIGTMARERNLKTDWLYAGSKPLVEVDMSEAQWASFVSSMNTSAVPCTIRRTESDWDVPGLDFAPRLALSMQEAKDSARDAYAAIVQAQAALDALDKKAPAAQRKAAEADLHRAIEHAAGNVDFASKQLVEHAENVVQKARADVEAVVVSKARALGLTDEQAAALLAMPTTPGEIEA